MDREPKDRRDYLSFLLRLWRGEKQDTWRASLQSTATARIIHFTDVEAMIAFLVAELAAEADDAGAREPAIEDQKH